MRAACSSRCDSSSPLRVSMRSSVSARMRAISALDHSRTPAMSSSAMRRSSVTSSAERLWTPSTWFLASTRNSSSVLSRCFSSSARMARTSSVTKRAGLRGATAGGRGVGRLVRSWARPARPAPLPRRPGPGSGQRSRCSSGRLPGPPGASRRRPASPARARPRRGRAAPGKAKARFLFGRSHRSRPSLQGWFGVVGRPGHARSAFGRCRGR